MISCITIASPVVISFQAEKSIYSGSPKKNAIPLPLSTPTLIVHYKINKQRNTTWTFFFPWRTAASNNKNHLFAIFSPCLICSNLLPFLSFRGKCLEAKFIGFARPIHSCITDWKKAVLQTVDSKFCAALKTSFADLCLF